MKVHDVKCWPVPFTDLKDGIKLAEYRLNDRNYEVGDIFLAREWDPYGVCRCEGNGLKATEDVVPPGYRPGEPHQAKNCERYTGDVWLGQICHVEDGVVSEEAGSPTLVPDGFVVLSLLAIALPLDQIAAEPAR